MRPAVISGVGLVLSLESFGASLPYVDQLMIDYNRPDSPGAAVVIVKDDQLLHMKGYGDADLESNLAASEQTSFRLASVSKQFIGISIAILESEGNLSLDQNLKEMFPEFPSYGSQITIRHLLHHLSGLPDYEELIPAQQTSQVSDYDVLNLYITKTRAAKFRPGSQYSYSNGGYVLLGLIIERISGKTLNSFLRERIFSRLGMSSMMYEGEGTPIIARAFGYSQAGTSWHRSDQSVTSATRGDGGIYASINDLLLWDRALRQNLANPIFSNELLAKIFSPGRFNNGQSCGYGFGWQLDSWRGLRRQGHTGSTIGFRTALQRYPDEGLMIAVLTNRNDGTPWAIAERIAERVLNLSNPEPEKSNH